MKPIVFSGFAASVMLAGCVTAPEHRHMVSHEACMAKMHPKSEGVADHPMKAGDKDMMMKKCPMMQVGHDMPGGSTEHRDHGVDAAHKN
jgi:hypothetical protein